MVRKGLIWGSAAIACVAVACADGDGTERGGEAGEAGASSSAGAEAGAGSTPGGGTSGSDVGGSESSGGSSGGSGGGGDDAGGAGSSGGTDAQGGDAATDSGTGAADGGDAGSAGESPEGCSIEARHELSAAIGTVGIVTFTTNRTPITGAYIEFGLDTDYGMRAPVDLEEPDYRTLLLGMKQRRQYHYRVVARSEGAECVSRDYALTTGSLRNGLPHVTVTGKGTGFLHTCFFGLRGGGPRGSFILDEDGEYVWYGGTGEMGRAEIHPDNKHLYYASVSPQGSGGSMRRIRLDGTAEEDMGAAFSGIHHDFTIREDGTIAFIRRVGTSDWVAEWRNGISQNLFNVTEMFGTGNPHVNSIHYNPADDSYTLADRNFNAYVKATRAGVKLWKLGGAGSSFTGNVTWSVNHGHQMIGDTGILFFNNGNTGRSRAIELTLDLETMVATEVWTYAPQLASSVLGDVQILGNGNRVITFSTAGVIEEIRPSDLSIVQSIEFDTGGAVGYSTKRASLYGPPPR